MKNRCIIIEVVDKEKLIGSRPVEEILNLGGYWRHKELVVPRSEIGLATQAVKLAQVTVVPYDRDEEPYLSCRVQVAEWFEEELVDDGHREPLIGVVDESRLKDYIERNERHYLSYWVGKREEQKARRLDTFLGMFSIEYHENLRRMSDERLKLLTISLSKAFPDMLHLRELA